MDQKPGSSHAALHSCDLQVLPGEHVAVVGPSGSGKSTFLNVLGLLDRPTTGRYKLANISVNELSDNQRAALRGRYIGFVFQSFHLLSHRSAQENVMMAQLYQGISYAERSVNARAALESVGLGHRITSLPSRMSGGERQRVAIARAIAGQPRVLLCDEPTGNLDSVTAARILDLIDVIRGTGLTVIVITHDRSVARRADRVIQILDGNLSDESDEMANLHV